MADDARPLELDVTIKAGATYSGLPVRRITIDLPDGRAFKLEMPPTSATKRTAETELGAAILQALASEKSPLKGATIAKLSGYGFSGSFRQVLKALVDEGDVIHDKEGYCVSD